MKLHIEGMHCAACKALVQMKLEENGFGEKIDGIDVLEDNTGVLILKGVTEEDVEHITQLVNDMDDYLVL